MRYYGVHVGHDAGVAVIGENGDLEFYAQCERFHPRVRLYGWNLNPIAKYIPKPKPDDFIVISALGEACRDKVEGYDKRLVMKFLHSTSWTQKLPTFLKPELNVNHHLCHALQAWAFRTDDRPRLFMAYDGAGATPLGKHNSSLVGYISNSGIREEMDAHIIPSSVFLAHLLGGKTSAGKAMGLAGYYPNAKIEWNDDNVQKLLEMIVCPENDFLARYPTIQKYDEKNLEFVAGFYKYWMQQTWNTLEANIDKFSNNQGIVIGGGTSLALELNTLMQDKTKDVVFGPAADDSGQALGAAVFAYWHVNRKWVKFSNPSCQHLPSELPKIGPQQPNELAFILNKNTVVGLLRRQAEAGPRALGYRSILASAERQENLKRVSQIIKGRERYRPLAPIVTSEEFDRYFIGPMGEYMQYRCFCTPLAKKELPAIVHVDGSARPQVVYKSKDPFMHELLVEYSRTSGHQCLINTSLNGRGRPICNTYEDAVSDMQNKDITLVCVPRDRILI